MIHLLAGLAAWVPRAYRLAWETPYLASLAAALGGYAAGAAVEGRAGTAAAGEPLGG